MSASILQKYLSDRTYILLLVLFFSSCSSNAIEVSVKNATSVDLESLEITNDKREASTGVFSLSSGQEIRKQLSLSSVSSSDGHYVVKIKGRKDHKFGYYSNGLPLDSKINIEVRIDTVLIQME